jgi:DNA-binding transcriptional ArsR family regulator
MVDTTSGTKSGPGPARQERVVLRDPRAIKALAHPARLAVIDEFFAGRRLTATECAEIAGLSASAMSYHLRALEKWGIIRRSETTGDGRERPWEAAGDRLVVDSAEPLASAAGEAVLVARLLDRQRADTLAYLSSQHETGSAWYDAMSISSGTYWLTLAEAVKLSQEMATLLNGFDGRRSGSSLPPDTRRVRVSVSIVPVPVQQADPAPAG